MIRDQYVWFVWASMFLLPWLALFAALSAAATLLCRPDLTRKTFYGGFLFLGFYIVFLQGLELLSPGYVERFWKLSVLSGIVIASMPLEELLFAFTLGMYWTSVYEHLTWITAIRETRRAVASPSHPEFTGIAR